MKLTSLIPTGYIIVRLISLTVDFFYAITKEVNIYKKAYEKN